MEYFLIQILKPLGIGGLIGVAIGWTGVGGGVLVTPALIYLLHIPPVTAVGTGLAYALITKIRGVIEHRRLKNIDIRTSIFFCAGAIPATIASSQIINYLDESGRYPGLDTFLQYTMGSILVLTAGMLIVQNIVSRKARYPEAGDRDRDRSSTLYKIGAIISGLFVGTLIGATSIGGGVLIIPILSIFFKMRPSETVGTSIIIALACSLAGSASYIFAKNINLPILIPMCAGSLAGVTFGSRLTRKIPESVMKIILAAAIIAGTVSFFWGASR